MATPVGEPGSCRSAHSCPRRDTPATRDEAPPSVVSPRRRWAAGPSPSSVSLDRTAHRLLRLARVGADRDHHRVHDRPSRRRSGDGRQAGPNATGPPAVVRQAARTTSYLRYARPSPIVRLSRRTIGDGLAYLRYEVVRAA